MTVRRALIGLLLLASTGCTGSLLQSHADHPQAYRLISPPLAAGGETLNAGLSVARPRAAASLDTDRIAVEQPGNAFDYFAGVRWSEPAPQMLQQLLVAALAADARFVTTVAAPSRVPTEYLLDIELRRFAAEYADAGAPPQVRVQWQATLIDARRGTRDASFLVEADARATSNRREALVAAFQQAAAEAVTKTVAGVRAARSGVAP